MNKPLKILVIILSAGFLIGAVAVYYIFNKPHRNINLETAAYSINAQSFFVEFSNHKALSNKKYVDRVVQVTGTIAELFVDDTQVSIVLYNSNKGVNCELDEITIAQNRQMVKALKVGDEITLKGKCDGFDVIMGVVLTQCFIVR